MIFNGFLEEVRRVAAVGQKLIPRWEAARKGCRARLGVDQACCHEEPDRPCFGSRDGMQFGIPAALDSVDQVAWGLDWPPFFYHRLVAMRCASRSVESVTTVFGTAL